MKKYFVIFMLIFGLTTKSNGQKEAQMQDTLKINTFSVNLDFLFHLTHKQMDKHPDIKFINAAQANYVVNGTDFGLYFRQIFDRMNNGYLYYNHYLNLSVGFGKYKLLPKKRAIFRIFYPEPVFIFQNNAGRGLKKRFQTGLFFYPVRHFRQNIQVNFGLGCLYDWSSWEVNNINKIDASPPDVREKILFVNSHTKLRKDMYMDHSEFRPTLFLSLGYKINDLLNLSIMTSYQQSVVSPFNEEIKAAYPELKKVYPYIFSQWAIGVKVAKGFSLKSTVIVDYENNNLSIYDSSWEYSILFGITWSFSKQ